jgi:hypothetical protein
MSRAHLRAARDFHLIFVGLLCSTLLTICAQNAFSSVSLKKGEKLYWNIRKSRLKTVDVFAIRFV